MRRPPSQAFRVNLTRAARQVDTNPDDGKVEQLHAQMLGELEAIIHRTGSKEQEKAKDAPSAKIKGVEDPNGLPKNPKLGKTNPKLPQNPKTSSTQDATNSGGTPCSFYSTAGGCKKGADCTFVHNWTSIPAAERPQRCRNCGAKGHRAVECKAGLKREEKAKYKSPPSSQGTGGPKGPSPNPSTAAVPPPKKYPSNRLNPCLQMRHIAASFTRGAKPGRRNCTSCSHKFGTASHCPLPEPHKPCHPRNSSDS